MNEELVFTVYVRCTGRVTIPKQVRKPQHQRGRSHHLQSGEGEGCRITIGSLNKPGGGPE